MDRSAEARTHSETCECGCQSHDQREVISLHDALVGHSYRVVALKDTGPVRKRLMDFGLTKGCEFVVKKVAPLGDPVQISLRGFELSLRKADAACVHVQDICDSHDPQ